MINRIIILFFLLVNTSIIAQDNDFIYHENQIFVKFKEHFPLAESLTPSKAVVDFFESYRASFQVIKIQSSFWFSKSSLNRINRVQFLPNQNLDEVIRLLTASGQVEYAEKIPVSKHYLIPNDLGSNTTATGGQWYLYKIKAPQAWDIQTGNTAIKVAIVDDAMQIAHSDLQGMTLSGFDIADNDADVNPPATAWDHGTHIGGLIGANTNNGTGMASLAFGVKLLPIKITSDSSPNVLISEYEGVAFAVNQGARVINMSWGASVPSQTGLAVINEAYNSGVVLVAAAGNDGNSNVNYPAGYQGVISVGATNNIDVRASFSNYGSSVDISAPGSQIWSLAPNNGTSVKNGTSFAAPLVSAAAALLLSANPSLSPSEVESCLLASADNIDVFNPNYIGLLGAGRLNVQQALACLSTQTAQYNAWLSNIIAPSLSSCDNQVSPFIRIVNAGLDTIQSLTITSKIDNGFTYTKHWTGQILPGLSQNILLQTSVLDAGNHTLQVNVLGTINDAFQDAFMANNFLYYSFHVNNTIGSDLPFVETFESNSLNTNNWSIGNSSGTSTWEFASSIGTSPGNKSLRLPYFSDFSTGTSDYLISPTFNFTGYSSINLTFDYAYEQRYPWITDSLAFSISSDCGQTWNRLWSRGENQDSTYNFATSEFTGSFFTPQSPNDWCEGFSGVSCGSINLNSFIGMTGVRFRFEGYNSNGNNIYIDNINLSGVSSNDFPLAGFSVPANNLVCQNIPVQFTNTSLNNPESFSWSFEGATPANSSLSSPSVTYSTPGSYDVELIVTTGLQSDTLKLVDYIVVNELPDVQILASSDSICLGTQITLQATGASSFYWNPGPGLVSSDVDSVNVSPTSNSNYSIAGVSDIGCVNTDNVAITIISPPAAPTITMLDYTMVAIPAQSYIWYVNGVEIPDSDTMYWQPIYNGNYNVRIYDQYGCTAISSPFTFSWVGLDVLPNQEIRMFPNPTINKFMIESEIPIECISVYSSTGQLQFSKSGDFKTLEIGSDSWSAGVYLVRIKTSTSEYSRHLLISTP
jgi:PKD repeat protein